MIVKKKRPNQWQLGLNRSATKCSGSVVTNILTTLNLAVNMQYKLITKSVSGVGTFGEFSVKGETLFYTVERDWVNNTPFKSCVPAGIYKCIPYKSPRFGNSFGLINENVGVTLNGPSVRTHCIFHVANFPEDVQGCIGLGLRPHPNLWGVADSKKAMASFMQLVGDKPFELEIIRN